jgi:D-glycerate 3-kinase
MNPIAASIARSIDRWREAGTPLILGICGTQASGKTTACGQIADHYRAQGLNVGVMSLDDLYLGRAARAELARDVHPLLITRGPPGTHDVALGVRVFDAVQAGEAIHLPRFDKAQDEPMPESDCPLLEPDCDLFLFEGWCVGAVPQPAEALAEPVNALERDEDPDAIWRRWFMAQLAGPTAELFSRIARLVYLRPPSFDVVFGWRCQQEHELIAKAGPGGAPRAMTDAQIARFIAHYERITRWIADEMATRADLTLQLDSERGIVSEIAKS